MFRCVTASGGEAVFKVTVTSAEAAAEAAALSAWRDSGAAVRLLDADVASATLLLERISPGTPLPGGDEATAVEVAAALLSRLHAAPRPAFPFPTLARAYPARERRARADAAHELRTRGAVPAGLPLLPRARAAAMRLCASSARDVLLHGDFLDKNLLRDGARYVAIDPMPRVGDPCSDIGFFAAAHPPAAAMLDRAGALATRLGEDPLRAARWTAVWAVGEACETWRADSSELAAALTSAAVDRLLDR